MKKLMIFLLLLLIPLSLAGNFEYKLLENKVLTTIHLEDFEFDSLEIPEDINILDFKENGESILKFTSKGFIEESGGEYFFISSNSLHESSSVKVILPEGASLTSKNIIFPKNYDLTTNGYNIILEWNNTGEKEILIYYKMDNKDYFWFYIILIVLVGLFYFYFKFIYDKKSYSKNLFREEKMIIKYLEKKKECWTKEIVRDLNIPKVKLSRKIRSLEEKGLIKKTPFGNENRIALVRRL